MATLVLVPGSQGHGILHESDGLVVFAVNTSRPETVRLLDTYRFPTIIVNPSTDIGQMSREMIREIIDGFYQATIIYLKE